MDSKYLISAVIDDIVRMGSSGDSYDGVTGTFADFSGVNLVNASFRFAMLHGSDFSNANMRGSVLSNADVAWCDFSGTDLTDAVIVDSDFTGAVYNSRTIWPIGFDPIANGCIKEDDYGY